MTLSCMNFYYIRLFWLGVLITGKSKVNDDLEFKNNMFTSFSFS